MHSLFIKPLNFYGFSLFRTKQEEMRASKKNQTENKKELGAELSDTPTDSSNILSTELCIYIHAAFMASILIIGNLRFKSIKFNKNLVSFYFTLRQLIGIDCFQIVWLFRSLYACIEESVQSNVQWNHFNNNAIL